MYAELMIAGWNRCVGGDKIKVVEESGEVKKLRAIRLFNFLRHLFVQANSNWLSWKF